MSTPRIRVTAVVALLLSTVATWAVLIMVAIHVSETVLKTLDMIIELAAISPG